MKSYFSTNRVLAWTVACVAAATVFFACKKEVTTDTAPNNEKDNNTLAVAQHEAAASAMYSDLFETVAGVAISQGLDNARQANPGNNQWADVPAPSCPSAELQDATDNKWPKTVIIDFGESCLDRFGTYRSGILNVTLSGPLFDPASAIEVEPENYKLDGIPVEGHFKISGVSFNTTTGIQYTTELTGGRITLSDSVVITYSSKKTIKQIEGADTEQALKNPSDDVFSLEGTASLGYEKGAVTGATATFTTQEPLIKRWDCRNFSKGKLKVEVDGATGIIDYGNGVCDDTATITIGDKAKEIKL